MPAPVDQPQSESAVAARLADLLGPLEDSPILRIDSDAITFPLPHANGSFQAVVILSPSAEVEAVRLLREAARVATPGGKIAVAAQVVPNHKKAGRYVAAFERLRGTADSLYPVWVWTRAFEQVGLSMIHSEVIPQRQSLLEAPAAAQWSTIQITRLRALLVQAPARVIDWLVPENVAVRPAFLTHHVILLGEKSPLAE